MRVESQCEGVCDTGSLTEFDRKNEAASGLNKNAVVKENTELQIVNTKISHYQ